MIQNRNRFGLTCLFINFSVMGAASSSQQSMPGPTTRIAASLQELALKTLITHPAQLAKDLPTMHNENNPFYDQRYTIPAKSISDALLARIGIQSTLLDVKKDIQFIFSPDNRIIATWDTWDTINKTEILWNTHTAVNLWNIYTGEFLRTLKNPNEDVTSVAINSDRILALGSWDQAASTHRKYPRPVGSLCLWDTKTGKLLHTLQTQKDCVLALAFSFNGKLLASGGYNNNLTLWDPTTGKLIRMFATRLEEEYDRIDAVAFNHDDSLLACASTNGTVNIWDPLTGELLHTYQGVKGHANSPALHFSPDGSNLITVRKNAIQVWDVKTGNIVFTSFSKWGNLPVTLSPDGTIAAIADRDNTLVLRSTQTGEILHILNGHVDRINSLAFNGNGTLLASGSRDKTIILWDPKTGKALEVLVDPLYPITSVSFSPYGTTLATVSHQMADVSKSNIRLWRIDYQTDMISVTDINEQQFLLNAAQDWLTDNSYKVSEETYPIFQKLISRFPYLNDDRLFDSTDIGILNKLTHWLKG